MSPCSAKIEQGDVMLLLFKCFFLIIFFYFVILQLRTIQIGYRKIIGIRKKEMKQLKENEGVERSLLLAMAVIAGLTVANCYYNQPLLEMIRHDIGVSQHEANLITVVTQIGYALGLCFLIPMGDLYSRRRIIVVNMTVAAIMAVVIAVAHNVRMNWGSSPPLGVCSVIPQFFLPIPGQYFEKEY